MKKKKLIRLVCVAACLTFLGMGTMTYMGTHGDQIKAMNLKKEKEKQEDGLKLLQYYTEEIKKNKEVAEFEEDLRLELAKGISADEVQFEIDAVSRTIKIKIPTEDRDYFYDYPMLGKSQHIENMTMEVKDGYGVLTLTLDSAYEVVTNTKKGHKEFIYIDFVKPKEIYDKIIVIDAGHGGSDTGTVVEDCKEKDINLAILKQVKKLFDQEEKIKVYYTRLADESVSIGQRASLIEAVEADYVISIHNNSLSNKSASNINGTQVLYNKQAGKAAYESFASLCLKELTDGLGSISQGLEDGSSLYLLKQTTCPAALIEVGYLSNAKDRGKLSKEAYQKKAAKAIVSAILKAYDKKL